MLKIYTDGGARGNPGPAAIGVVIKKDGQTIIDRLKKLPKLEHFQILKK